MMNAQAFYSYNNEMMEMKAINRTNRIEGAKIPQTGHKLAVTL